MSQSAQFAPFTHDYDINTDTMQEFWIYDDTITRANPYKYVNIKILNFPIRCFLASFPHDFNQSFAPLGSYQPR